MLILDTVLCCVEFLTSKNIMFSAKFFATGHESTMQRMLEQNPSHMTSYNVPQIKEKFLAVKISVFVSNNHHITQQLFILLNFSISYLKSLIPSFNECVDQFLENLTMKADGSTEILMRKEFGRITLNILGKVYV